MRRRATRILSQHTINLPLHARVEIRRRSRPRPAVHLGWVNEFTPIGTKERPRDDRPGVIIVRDLVD